MSKKEMSILDAFIALEDLDDDVVQTPLKEGKGFNVRSSEEMEEAERFMEADSRKKTTLEVVDVDADTVEHLKDNKDYVGQMLIVCDSCGQTRFIDGEDLVDTGRISEKTKTELYNDELECSHCHQTGAGFTLRGQVAAVKPEEEVEPTIENDSLTNEVKFDNEEELPVEEPKEEPAQETEENVEEESEEAFDETSSEDDTADMKSHLGDEIDRDNVEYDDTEEAPKEEKEEDSLTKEDEDDNEFVKIELTDEEEDKKKEKKESLEEAIDLSIETFGEFTDNIIEPENIEKVVIYDLDSDNAEEEVYNGPYDELPLSAFDSELIDFSVGSSMLIINIDSESEIDELTVKVKDILKLFGDEFNSNISVWDQATGEEVFVGTKQSVIEEFGHNAFLSFEAPEILEVNLRNVSINEALKTPYNESLDLANSTDKLISDILKANGLKEYKLEKYGSDEYWLADSIRNLEDLDVIFKDFVKGKGEALELDFKENTGFKELFDECNLTEEVEINPDELHKEAQKLLNDNGAFACIYGYQKNGKVYGLKEKFILCKDQEQLDDKSEIVRLRYKPTGSIRVAYAGNAFEEFDYRNRTDLAKAIVEAESKGISYKVKKSVKEGYRYTLITESPERGFFTPAVRETEVEDATPEEAEEVTSTVVIDPRDAELVDKLTRISHDIAEAIREAYGVEVDERLILADMIQDLQLISGQLTPEEIADTPINNITREMYAAYNGFYEALDELTSFITGQPITTTTAQKIQQALASLDGEEFTTESIRERVRDPRFLLAMQQGSIPGITFEGNPEDIRLLDAPTEQKAEEEEEIDESLNEAKKEEELPADPEAVKTNVHQTINTLIADEIEAIDGYEEAKAEIIDSPIEHKDELLDTVDHIEDEEKEHVDELVAAATEIPFEKESDQVKLEQDERLADEANKEIESHIEQDIENAEELPELEEPVEESLKESVDIHVEGNEVTIADNSGEDVALIPIDPEKEETVEESKHVCPKCGKEVCECNKNESIEFNEEKFENFINEWLDKNFDETKLFETKDGFVKEDGTIILEGIMHCEEGKEEPASFTLTPKTNLEETIENQIVYESYTVKLDK